LRIDNTGCYDPGMETFGQRLRRLREEAHIGLNEFAERVGKDPGGISRIERGERWAGKAPPADDVARFADALRVSVDVLLGRTTGEQLTEGRARYLTEPIGALLDRLGVQKMADPMGRLEEFGASLGDDDRRTRLPQDIEYTLPKRQRGKKGTQYRAIVAYGQCMGAAVSDGAVVLFEDHGHAEPGELVVAVLGDEQIMVKRLIEEEGQRYLVSEQGHRYHVNGDVRLVGPVRLVMQRF